MTVGSQDASITWYLPKALLTHHSPFFAAALNGSFAEAKLNSVTMPDDDLNVFRLWVQWLYVGNVKYQILRVEDVNNLLVKAWILGDKLGCHIFQNNVMLELLKCHFPILENDLIEPSTLRAAYQGSAPGSMLRKWAIDFFFFETRKKESWKVSTLERNALWYREAKDIEDFPQDYMEASMNYSLEGGPLLGEPINPYHMSNRYMVR